MDDEYYRQLVQRYLNGTSTDGELVVFAHLVQDGKLDTYLKEAIDTVARIDGEDDLNFTAGIKKRNVFHSWLRYAGAAMLLLSVSITFYFYRHQPHSQQIVSLKIVHDALPGGNKATLTLANGSKVILDNKQNGEIARQGRTNINKVTDGRLVYRPLAGQPANPGNQQEQVIAWNTISTPRAGQYQVELPDGSKIWLNSLSSISFPIAFTGKERKVKITGEVYFEVAKNKNMPFLVETKGQTIRVLGTHFNINAYDDEQEIRTTLLEGSIRITTQNSSKLLIPGQQSLVVNNTIRIADAVNTEAVVAWKNDYFIFEHTDLPTLMRQLSRWYDVRIIYTGQVSEHEFVGEIKRKTNLSNVLKILALSGVHFKIENKNLLIQQ